MLNSILTDVITIEELLILFGVAIVLGIFTALSYSFKNDDYSKNFLITLIILPLIVTVVIMLVNGNLGAGIAVMGAFSLVRFRTVPGTSKEIAVIFMSVAIGLALGMGYVGIACILAAISFVIILLFNCISVGRNEELIKLLRITMPESLDYNEVFDDI